MVLFRLDWLQRGGALSKCSAGSRIGRCEVEGRHWDRLGELCIVQESNYRDVASEGISRGNLEGAV